MFRCGWSSCARLLDKTILVQCFELLVGGVFARRPLSLPVALLPLLGSALPRRIEKLHIRESSTDIKAPELSNSPQ